MRVLHRFRPKVRALVRRLPRSEQKQQDANLRRQETPSGPPSARCKEHAQPAACPRTEPATCPRPCVLSALRPAQNRRPRAELRRLRFPFSRLSRLNGEPVNADRPSQLRCGWRNRGNLVFFAVMSPTERSQRPVRRPDRVCGRGRCAESPGNPLAQRPAISA